MHVGTPMFQSYNRTLRRLMWADFIDEQMRVAREQQYRATLVDSPYQGQKSISASVANSRQMRSGG